MHQVKMEPRQQGWLDTGDFFSNAIDDAVPSFLLNRDMERVEYGPSDELQLYRSINVAYVSPEGRGQEICEGYICGIRSEVRLAVYIALVGKESGRTRIYTPEAQPADEERYRATVAAAIAFGDQIGLVMEPEKPGESPHQRLKGCPVLKERAA